MKLSFTFPGADELPRTGPAERLAVLGAAGASMVAAGAAALWWASRRRTGVPQG